MEKLKIYLDTNMIIDIFINQIKLLNGKDPEVPKKYEFMLAHTDKFNFVTSVLTKAEIARELGTAFHLPKEKIEKLWNGFITSLGCHYVDRFTIGEEFADIVYNLGLKLRTMMNFQHVFIAMRENAYFVSGDKDIIQKTRESGIYDKCLTYIELRNLAASFGSSRTHQDV